MISSLKYIEIPASSRNHFRYFETIFAAVLPPAGGLREGRNNTIKDRLHPGSDHGKFFICMQIRQFSGYLTVLIVRFCGQNQTIEREIKQAQKTYPATFGRL